MCYSQSIRTVKCTPLGVAKAKLRYAAEGMLALSGTPNAIRKAMLTVSTEPCSVRILNVVGVMTRAGIETWLMHVLRCIDRERFQIDFAVDHDIAGEYDEEIQDLGSSIYRIGPRNPFSYESRLKHLLASHGPYDVVHTHLNHYNGSVVRLAKQAGVAIRISHSHTDTTERESRAGYTRRLAIRRLQAWIRKYCSHGIAASIPAAISMFGQQWRDNDRVEVMHCGLDFSGFSGSYSSNEVRAELGIPKDGWVIGHVGRLIEVKNHAFLIKTFRDVLQHAPDAWLLLVGDGPLRQLLQKQAHDLGVANRVVFAGLRNDVPRLLCSAIDCIAFPSKLEGLGLTLVEAQAAGVPCLASEAIPEEACVADAMVQRISLDQSWTDAILSLKPIRRNPAQCLAQVSRSDFSIERNLDRLQNVYLSEHGQSRSEPATEAGRLNRYLDQR